MNDDFHAAWSDTSSTMPAPAATNDLSADAAKAKTASKLTLKQIVTIRLDVDMLGWFKDGGPGYQTRINQILRDHMDAQIAGQQAGGAPN